jgi:hypothetical protein
MNSKEKAFIEAYEKGYGDGAADAFVILLVVFIFVTLIAG